MERDGQIWTCTGGNSNQNWIGEPNPDAVRAGVAINGGDDAVGAGDPWCIDATSDADGAEVALVGCFNSYPTTIFPNGNITWSIPVAPLTGQITTFNNKCLDVPNGSTENGVQLQIWTCTPGDTNQIFQSFTSGQIQWSGTSKCVDLTNGISADGNPIRMWDCSEPYTNPNQDWFFTTIDFPDGR